MEPTETLTEPAERGSEEAEAGSLREARDPEWVPTPEMLEAARQFASDHGFPGEEGYDSEEPSGPVLRTLEWVSENGWPTQLEDGTFVDLRDDPDLMEADVLESRPADRVPELGVEDSPGVEVDPGEQGSATVEESEGSYSAPDPGDLTPGEVEEASSLVSDLRSGAEQMDVTEVVDGLVQVVDVHPDFRVPRSWPADEEEKYCEAAMISRVGEILCRGVPNIEIAAGRVVFVWRSQQSWTKAGKKVLCQAKPHGRYTRFISEGVVASVQVHYEEYLRMNPLQKVFVVYRGLRRLDASGKRIPWHFSGFKDELEVFGGRVMQEFVTLRAGVEGAKDRESELDYQLSLLEGESG